MKLVQKLTLTMVVGMCVVGAVHGFLRVRRDAEFFQTDMRRDHQLPGRLLGAVVAGTWRTEGRERALKVIHDADQADNRVRITWIDGPPTGAAGLREGRFYTYVPVTLSGAVSLNGASLGTLELSESFDEEAAYIRSNALRTMTTTLILAMVAAVLVAVLGTVFVGGPMRRLTEKARRVGAGDLTGPLRLPQHDEIGELAREMNAMCDRLAETNRRLSDETTARLRALEQLRHADRLATVGKLASGVAHELGTPLNVVSARAKMIASREVEGDALTESARIIGEQADRITRIVRQLLDFARGRAGSAGGSLALTSRHPGDLRALAQRAITLLGSLAEKRQVVLSLEPAAVEAPAAMVQLDDGGLDQAVTNLVVNAIHAMSQPGRVTLSVEMRRVTPPADLGGGPDDYLRLAVRDQGSGIAPDVLPHIFEPFFTTKDVGEGTGLGLSVSYGIVRDHGGWITVDSAPGRGSTFNIYLPPVVPERQLNPSS